MVAMRTETAAVVRVYPVRLFSCIGVRQSNPCREDMLQKKVYFKSGFKVFLESKAGWTGLPFRLKFYTGAPSRAFVACFDGTEYHNCHLHEDGRLCVAFDNHNFGFGTLRMEPTFYLNDACYRDGICDEAITPFDVVCVKYQYDEEGKVIGKEEYTIVLAMDGVKTLETIGTLPAFYQKGEKGDKGDKGDTGEQGPVGPQGAQGPVGPQGERGEQGERGADGAQGRDGAPGPQGPAGEDGQRGEKGDKGDKGDTYTITDADYENIAAKVKTSVDKITYDEALAILTA